jgi:glycerol-3-phosphate dehydrogenase
MAGSAPRAVVIGGGVVGTAVAMQLARRGARVTLLERLPALALQASGTSSGILHTGFDSTPGDLETRLILRSAAIRGELLEALGVPVMECGAILTPEGEEQLAAVEALEANARENGVEVSRGTGGTLEIPGEHVTDPVACTYAWASAATGAGATILLGSPAGEVRATGSGVEVEAPAGALQAEVAINCAGLHGGEVSGDRFAVYPRKGEFLVFDQPREQVAKIQLPVPERGTKGVLVFPTLDGHAGAGPTAVDQDDRDDWKVGSEGEALIRSRLAKRSSPLAGAEAVFRYAGLRPAGRNCNYVIGESPKVPGLVDVGAIRSTGLSASAAIGEYVCQLVAAMGNPLSGPSPVKAGPVPGPVPRSPWWRRTADFEAGIPL